MTETPKKIGKYEITAEQYTEFLNAVAADDTHSLYHASMAAWDRGCGIEQAGAPGAYSYSVPAERADRPVNYLTFWDCARFANWIHNGQPSGAHSADPARPALPSRQILPGHQAQRYLYRGQARG